MKKKKIIQASVIEENINNENKITKFNDRQDLLKKNQETIINSDIFFPFFICIDILSILECIF